MAKFKPYLFGQAELLPASLDEWIPTDDLVRTVSDIVEELDLSELIARYSERGEEAYHPRMMVKILFYGVATGVFSSRELQRKIHFDICFRWLCGIGDKPDFRTISDFRKNNLDVLPKLFRDIVEIAGRLGYVSLRHVSIDGSKIKANASKHKAMSRERMKQELARIEKEIGQALEAAQVEDESHNVTVPLFELQGAPTENLIDRRDKIKAALAELEERKPDDESEDCKKDQISFTDPDSRIMNTKNQGVIQAYNPQIAVDADNGFIVGVSMSNSSSDQQQFDAVLDSIQENTGRMPQKVTADAGYFSAANIKSCQSRKVDGYIAASREGRQVGNSFDKQNFTYDPQEDVYVCPAGKMLTLKQTQHAKDPHKSTKWVYECQACPECPFQKECARAKSGLRTITRTEADPVREAMRTKVQSEEGKAIYRQRKMIVEPVWGEVKQVQGFRQFNLRGKEKVHGEFLLVAIGHNLRKLHAMSHPKPDTRYRRERSAQKRGTAA
ncbi:MAG: IS1182 family transposase [Alicyclobacillaceae bacterium]|nr:IS1182 family transposase [Alicyclobacillaceae bacterium]